MANDPCNGGTTLAHFLDLWKSTNDALYVEPFLEQGEGNGLEVHTQAMTQYARVSCAVDRATQAMYIRPFAGQTAPPAQGEAKASVKLSFSREFLSQYPLVLSSDYTIVEEDTDDATDEGALPTLTGRRYRLDSFLVFGQGELGPLSVGATAEFPGYGYNNPLPGTLVAIPQPGTLLNNLFASVKVAAGSAQASVDCLNEPDVFVPEHVGQYLRFEAGANTGTQARILGYAAPDLTVTPPTGGTLILEALAVLYAHLVSGTPVPGEPISQGTASGTLLKVSDDPSGYKILVVSVLAGLFVAGAGAGALTGGISGAVFSSDTGTYPDAYVTQTVFVPETQTAGWRIMDWVLDFGLTVTNAQSPEGGRLGTLDMLGEERNLPRLKGEPDDVYRERVAIPADVVSPNAVKRTMNRVLGQFDLAGCFREPYTSLLPGFALDIDAFDYDPTLNVFDRFKFLLSEQEARGFFLIGVPSITAGEFGFAFDVTTDSALDATTVHNFFDGYPVDAASVYKQVYDAIDKVRAGGVGFDLYLEDIGCFLVTLAATRVAVA